MEKDRHYLLERKKDSLKGVIMFSLITVPFLAGLIGTFLIQFFLPGIYDLFSFFVIFGRIFLALMTTFNVTFLIIYSMRFHKARKVLKGKIFVNSPLENSILQFLIDHQDKSFTIEVLLNEIHPTGTIQEMQASLDLLKSKKKIKQEMKDLAPHYFANLKKLGLA